MSAKKQRIVRVTSAYIPEVGLAVWPREAGSWQQAATGDWPCGYITQGEGGTWAVFTKTAGAEDIWHEFSDEASARRWLVRQVRKALQARERQ